MRFVNTNLAESCIRYGDRDALYCHDDVICYRQLAIRVEQVCQFIRDQSLVDQRIMIHLPKSIDYVVAIYAVLATGNSYVPIDASQPQERADMIWKQANPSLVITESDLMSHYAGETMPVLTMDTISPMDEWFGPGTLEDAIMQWHRPHPDKIAAILFTSGSTGTPKGVQISHAMLSHFIEWSVADLELSHNDVFSNHASYAFDLSTFDLFAASRVGAAVWIIRKEQQHDVSALLKGIEQHQVTIWYSVPTVLSMLVASGELTSRYTDLLRHVIFAGEPYPMGALRHLCECLSPYCQLSNWYGPTETNVCFAYRFHPASPELNDFTQLPIGHPLPYMYASIIDEQGHTSEVRRDQEHGEPGELLVEGVGVTPGYSNLIDPKNSEHHRHHRHATGDIVHCEQGLYYFHGRVDDMVKLNGHRVELGEIEACLSQMPGVHAVAVIVQLGERQQKLIAYLVVDKRDRNKPSIDELDVNKLDVNELDVDELDIDAPVAQQPQPKVNLLTVKQYVSERLPRYMVPHAVRFLPELPINANGKVDRKRLKNEGR